MGQFQRLDAVAGESGLQPDSGHSSALQQTDVQGQRTNPLTRERAARGAEFVATTECQLR
jgi:hypothetical protein